MHASEDEQDPQNKAKEPDNMRKVIDGFEHQFDDENCFQEKVNGYVLVKTEEYEDMMKAKEGVKQHKSQLLKVTLEDHYVCVNIHIETLKYCNKTICDKLPL